jgi:hypothetical protein
MKVFFRNTASSVISATLANLNLSAEEVVRLSESLAQTYEELELPFLQLLEAINSGMFVGELKLCSQLSDTEIQQLAEALRGNTTLNALNLAECDLTTAGAIALLQILEARVTDAAAAADVGLEPGNQTLEEIRLGDTSQLDPFVIAKLELLLRLNRIRNLSQDSEKIIEAKEAVESLIAEMQVTLSSREVNDGAKQTVLTQAAATLLELGETLTRKDHAIFPNNPFMLKLQEGKVHAKEEVAEQALRKWQEKIAQLQGKNTFEIGNEHLNDDDVDALVQILENNHQITTFKLSEVELAHLAAEKLVKGLQTSKLHRLLMPSEGVSSALLEQMDVALEKNRFEEQVRMIALETVNNAHDENFLMLDWKTRFTTELVACFLTTNPGVTGLYISVDQEFSLDEVIEVLRTNKTVTHLTLPVSREQWDSVGNKLREMLQQNTTLIKIMTPAGDQFKQASELLNRNKDIAREVKDLQKEIAKIRDFSGNELTQEGPIELLELVSQLKANRAQGIESDDEISIIAFSKVEEELLNVGKILAQLRTNLFPFNPFVQSTSVAVAVEATPAAAAPSINWQHKINAAQDGVLRVEDPINASDILQLAIILEKNQCPRLTVLELVNNFLAVGSVWELMSALGTNTHLQQFTLQSSQWSADCGEVLYRSLEKNHTLLSLNIRDEDDHDVLIAQPFILRNQEMKRYRVSTAALSQVGLRLNASSVPKVGIDEDNFNRVDSDDEEEWNNKL